MRSSPKGCAFLAERRRHRASLDGGATLGQTIRGAREARGLTQSDLAARSHVAQADLSYLEQDQRANQASQLRPGSLVSLR